MTEREWINNRNNRRYTPPDAIRNYRMHERLLFDDPDEKDLLSHARALPIDKPHPRIFRYTREPHVKWYRKGYRTPYDYFLAHSL